MVEVREEAGPDGASWAELLRERSGCPVQLVATDLDGTLLRPDGSVSERTVDAVRAARAAGLHVVPVTGRPPQVAWDVISTAGLGPLGVCSNGAALVETTSMEVLESVSLGSDVAEALVAELREFFPDAIFAAEGTGFFVHEPRFIDEVWSFSRDEGLAEVPDLVGSIPLGCTKLIMRRPGNSPAEVLADLVEAVAERGHVTTSGLDWVEIGAPGISKAYALERVCDRLGVSVSGVLAIGDYHNDLTVLAWAGRAAAPANAIPEVLAVVQYVIPSNAEDGVAQLLEELLQT